MTRIPELEQELVAAAGRLQTPRRLRRPGRRWALAAAAVGIVVVAFAVLGATEQNHADRRLQPVGTAPGAKVVTNVRAGVRFSLDGRVLTLHLLPSTPVRTLRRVSGARISATCGASVAAPPADRRATTLTRLWPAGQASLRFRFPQDVSGWCWLADPVGRSVAFVTFPGASPRATERGAAEHARLLIHATATNWARLFASGTENPHHYMGQPAAERMNCQRVGALRPIPNCTRPSRAYRLSFRGATVQEIAIKGDRAAARFSNGETIELQGASDGSGWPVAKWGENAGRGFFK